MNSKYLSEAFKQLDLLNEEDFALDDKGIEGLEKINDEESVFDTLDVIDKDANTEEELEDSYIGKVILECCVCHSKIYENKEDVKIGEDGTLTNAGEECPFCFSTDGYKLIGQVEPYEAPTEFDVTVEPKEECEDGECKDEEVDTEVEDKDIDESLTEALDDNILTRDFSFAEWKSFKKYWNKERKDKGLRPIDVYTDDASIVASDDNMDCSDLYVLKETQTFKELADALDNVIKSKYNEALCASKEIPILNDEEKAKLDADVEAHWKEVGGKPFAAEEEKAHKAFEDSIKNEGLENIDIETEHDRIHVQAEEKPETDDEMLAPLSPDTEEQVGLVDTETPVEEVPEETSEVPVDTEEDVDIPIEDFDEEGFDELGESFLKKIYENVDGFKTTGVKSKGNTLTVEGLINFASGKSKKTSFVFEAAHATKEGKVRFVGFNEGLSSGKKSFRLSGSVSNNRLVVESLGYHFIAKDASGKTGRVNGTVRVK